MFQPSAVTDHKMDTNFYLEKFKNAAGQINKTILAQKQLEVASGLYKESVVLKLYKNSWANPLQDPLSAETRIFFSVWVSGASVSGNKLLYNIHALKLRKLQGYSIESRKFAEDYRNGFKSVMNKWPNVDLNYGPLTLMQGWVNIEQVDIENEIVRLANNFIEISYLIDDTLAKFKK